MAAGARDGFTSDGLAAGALLAEGVGAAGFTSLGVAFVAAGLAGACRGVTEAACVAFATGLADCGALATGRGGVLAGAVFFGTAPFATPWAAARGFATAALRFGADLAVAGLEGAACFWAGLAAPPFAAGLAEERRGGAACFAFGADLAPLVVGLAREGDLELDFAGRLVFDWAIAFI